MEDPNEVTIIILIDNKVLAIRTSKAKISSLLSLTTVPQTSDSSTLKMSVVEDIKTSEKYN